MKGLKSISQDDRVEIYSLLLTFYHALILFMFLTNSRCRVIYKCHIGAERLWFWIWWLLIVIFFPGSKWNAFQKLVKCCVTVKYLFFAAPATLTEDGIKRKAFKSEKRLRSDVHQAHHYDNKETNVDGNNGWRPMTTEDQNKLGKNLPSDIPSGVKVPFFTCSTHPFFSN